MLKLIVNADDFGLTQGCNIGIMEALQHGIVSDTTVLINAKYAKEAIEMAKASGINRIGIHLNLTCGRPVLQASDVRSLTDSNGKFINRVRNLIPVVNFKEAEMELRAQVEMFFKTGIELNHIDCHHHLHMYDGFAEIVNKLAKELRAPLRHTDPASKKSILSEGISTTDYFTMEFYGEKATAGYLKNILNRHDDGILEIMTHPGKADEELFEVSSYSLFRERELEVLTSEDVRDFINEKSIQLINYDSLRCYNEQVVEYY